MFVNDGKSVDVDDLANGFTKIEEEDISSIQFEGKLINEKGALVDRVTRRADVIDFEGVIIGQDDSVTSTPVEYKGSLIKDGDTYKSVVTTYTDLPLFDKGEVWSGEVNGAIVTISSINEAKAVKLQLAISQAKQQVSAFASSLRAKLAGTVDPVKLGSWSNKAGRANRIVNGMAFSNDANIVQQECDKRGKGETVEQLAALHIKREEVYLFAVSTIDGMESNARSVFDEVTDVASIPTMEEAMKANALVEMQNVQAVFDQL